MVWENVTLSFLLLFLGLAHGLAQGYGKLSPAENKKLLRSCGISPGCLVPKVFGGKLACPGQFPWTVAQRMVIDISMMPELTTKLGKSSQSKDSPYEVFVSTCTGTLISPRHVLTAAHCFHQCKDNENKSLVEDDPTSKRSKDILVGSLNASDSNSKLAFKRRDVKLFDGWGKGRCRKGGDLAIIELDRNVPPEIGAPICLPSSKDMLFNEPLTGAGFGLVPELGNKKLNSELRYVDFEIKDEYVQRNDKGTYATPFGALVAYEPPDKNVCEGDSGGPLMMKSLKSKRTILAGVTSFGSGCKKMHENLAKGVNANYEGAVFTDTRHYLNWICEVTNIGNCGQQKQWKAKPQSQVNINEIQLNFLLKFLKTKYNIEI